MRSLTRSKGRLLFLVCLVLAGYFTYTAASDALRNHQLATEQRAAEQNRSNLEAKKQYLQAVKDYVSSDAYVEQQARRQLGYVRDGEISFAVISPPPSETAQPSGDWWQRLFPR
jgi:cell division protein FtsB